MEVFETSSFQMFVYTVGTPSHSVTLFFYTMYLVKGHQLQRFLDLHELKINIYTHYELIILTITCLGRISIFICFGFIVLKNLHIAIVFSSSMA